MNKKITIEYNTEAIKEVTVSWSMDEVNILLNKGWILLTGSFAHKDESGFQAKPCFILAKKS